MVRSIRAPLPDEDCIRELAIASMVATAFEERVNVLRGYATLVITMNSMYIVLSSPLCLIFWRNDGYERNAAPTGLLGLVTSLLFLLYLLVDTLVGLA